MKLKEIRIEKGFKQKDLAEKLNRTITCICDWERERTQPSIEDLVKLSQILNCTIDYLIGNENDFGIIENKTDLNYREKKLLENFKFLDDDEKDKIIEDCEYFANKHITFAKNKKNNA